MILAPRARNGAERTYGYTAYFPSGVYTSNPIFHISGYYVDRILLTACGVRVWEVPRGTIGISIPTRFAVLFARPCKRCLKAVERARS